MKPVAFLALLAIVPVLSAPAAAGASGSPVTIYMTAACGGNSTSGCATPGALVVEAGTSSVALTVVNNGTAPLHLDACILGGSGSDNTTSGSVGPCPTLGGTNATSKGGPNGTSAGGTNSTTSKCATGSGNMTGTGGTNSTGGAGMNATSSLPVTVPGCGAVHVALMVPATGAVSLFNTATGRILFALTTANATSGGTTGNTTNGTITTPTNNGTFPTSNGSQESSGNNASSPGKGTPGFEAPLLVTGVAVAVLALRRRQK